MDRTARLGASTNADDQPADWQPERLVHVIGNLRTRKEGELEANRFGGYYCISYESLEREKMSAACIRVLGAGW